MVNERAHYMGWVLLGGYVFSLLLWGLPAREWFLASVILGVAFLGLLGYWHQ